MAATTSKSLTTVPALPNIGDVIDGDKLGDDILASAAARDTNTKKIINGGVSAKFQPRAWSYGGQID
jgi:hypothetical protein